MKILILFIFTSLFLYAAPTPIQHRKNKVIIGIGGSTADKIFEADTGDGATNPKITVDGTVKDFTFSKNLKTIGDILGLGDGTTGAAKDLIFDTGDGGSNKKLSLDTSKNGSFNVNIMTFGDGTAGNKDIVVDKGGSNPVIRWNNGTGKWQISVDGTVFNDMATSNVASWHVLAKIDSVVAGNVSLGITGDSGTFSEITSTGLTLVDDGSTGVTSVWISCLDTFPSTGTTCTGGTTTESAGVAFTPPTGFSGLIEVCATFPHEPHGNIGPESIFSYFRISGTTDTSSAETIVVGQPEINSGIDVPGGTTDVKPIFSINICGTFTLASDARVNFRLFESTNGVVGTPPTNKLKIQDVRQPLIWSIKPI